MYQHMTEVEKKSCSKKGELARLRMVPTCPLERRSSESRSVAQGGSFETSQLPRAWGLSDNTTSGSAKAAPPRAKQPKKKGLRSTASHQSPAGRIFSHPNLPGTASAHTTALLRTGGLGRASRLSVQKHNAKQPNFFVAKPTPPTEHGTRLHIACQATRRRRAHPHAVTDAPRKLPLRVGRAPIRHSPQHTCHTDQTRPSLWRPVLRMSWVVGNESGTRHDTGTT